jgi:hypothetical protein
MQAPTRATALAMHLADLHGWHLAAHCARCRLLVRVEVARLAVAHGSAVLGAVVRRLRCSRCGASPESVTLANGAEGDGRADLRRVRLV